MDGERLGCLVQTMVQKGFIALLEVMSSTDTIRCNDTANQPQVSGSPIFIALLKEVDPGSGSSPGGGNNSPLQYSYLENPGQESSGLVQRVSKSHTRLSRRTQEWHCTSVVFLSERPQLL